MTTLTSQTAVFSQTSILSAFASRFAEFCAGARDGLEIEARYDALTRKSDSDLAAIGLERHDVTRAALFGRHR